jgi:hypothetical protein
VVTNGLRVVGAPSVGQPQHNWYTSLPPRDVSIEHGVARARMVEAEVPGPTLELTREIRLDGGLRIRDTTRDKEARGGDWRRVGSPGPERLFEHVAARSATVSLGDLRITVRPSLPRLCQWMHPDYGVPAIEPANCSVHGRARVRADGRLPVLQPGEQRVTALEIDVDPA